MTAREYLCPRCGRAHGASRSLRPEEQPVFQPGCCSARECLRPTGWFPERDDYGPELIGLVAGRGILPTSDRKTRAWPGQRNTFGLMPGPGPQGTCPGATFGAEGCHCASGGRPACYVYRIMRIYPGVREVLEHNTKALWAAAHGGKVELLRKEFARFEADFVRRGLGGTPYYRLHWSGDIFSPEYADALRVAMEAYPAVQFWGYTRTFDVVPVFKGQANLRLYLSLDPCNEAEGLRCYQVNRWPRLHLAYMGRRRPAEPAGLAPCPRDEELLPLEGACQKCQLCLRGKNIWFKLNK